MGLDTSGGRGYHEGMIINKIVRAKDFSEVAEVKSDGKHRVALKRVKLPGDRYRVYENSAGQLLLDPVVTIPAAEAWLFANKPALNSVRKGLTQAAQGKLRKKDHTS